MPEGVNFVEVHSDAMEHAEEEKHSSHEGRWSAQLAIAEALILSLVTITVAWSGFAAAKWNSEGQSLLAQSALTGVQASRADLDAQLLREYDATTFNAWFTAYVIGNEKKMAVAEGRFRPVMKEAFKAWMATKPEENPFSQPGPTFMPSYVLPEEAEAIALAAETTRLHQEGLAAGHWGDEYVRGTVVLAGVLFLTGIGRTFTMHRVRAGLLGVGVGLLIYSLFLILQLPAIPA